MKQCPICHSEMDANFGMVQCLKCQSVLFIDFVGNIAIGGNEDLLENQDLAHSDQIPSDIELASSDYLEVVSTENEISNFDLDLNMHNDFESDEVNQQIYQNDGLEENNFSNNDFQNINQLGESPIISESENKNESTDLCFYQITVNGIDSSKLRKEVLDALRESRLGLVHNEIENNIIDGKLIVRGLNPVKASVIMNSFKDLPINIEWKTYVKENT